MRSPNNTVYLHLLTKLTQSCHVVYHVQPILVYEPKWTETDLKKSPNYICHTLGQYDPIWGQPSQNVLKPISKTPDLSHLWPYDCMKCECIETGLQTSQICLVWDGSYTNCGQFELIWNKPSQSVQKLISKPQDLCDLGPIWPKLRSPLKSLVENPASPSNS